MKAPLSRFGENFTQFNSRGNGGRQSNRQGKNRGSKSKKNKPGNGNSGNGNGKKHPKPAKDKSKGYKDNHKWKLVPPPHDAKPVSTVNGEDIFEKTVNNIKFSGANIASIGLLLTIQ